ncbi:PDZ domain-containing protein [Candidatus Pacearchaeota archaeon]|nr:PDZ domain-containing protein [Candidatus Pacearchaeota archaeon]
MKKLNWKIWLLIISLALAIILIFNISYLSGGLLIKDVYSNSPASIAGIHNGDILLEINSQKIISTDDYIQAISSIKIEKKQFTIITNEGIFSYNSSTLDLAVENDTIVSVYGNALLSEIKEGLIIEKIDEYALSNYSFNEIKQKVEPKVKIQLKTNKGEFIFLTGEDLGIVVSNIPISNLKMGLELQGGARALLKAEKELSSDEMQNLISVINYRLNTYGISDVVVRESRDLSGVTYIVIEMAGATPRELDELVSKQGKFEAKIGQNVVFVGGHNDITYVCRTDASCARIEQCSTVQEGTACRFSFEIKLSEAAAERQANFTSSLAENTGEKGKTYLNETLDLYLDDKLVDSLMISSDLKGQASTSISISGSGVGKNRQEAYSSATENMKKLQTILITGSLPFKLEVVKLDTVSPTLGKQFFENVLIAGLAAFIGVCLIIYLRYKKINLFIPVTITIISEVLLTLGIAALIKWNLDLASIAGIIAAIGTGVNDQIVMIDEAEHGRKDMGFKEKIKRAFTIIFGAYATVIASLVPLWWAGAGLLRGFAVTTLLGITVGVLITRPAFSEILKIISKE